jgi:hypothetical protein
MRKCKVIFWQLFYLTVIDFVTLIYYGAKKLRLS